MYVLRFSSKVFHLNTNYEFQILRSYQPSRDMTKKNSLENANSQLSLLSKLAILLFLYVLISESLLVLRYRRQNIWCLEELSAMKKTIF